MAYGKIKILRTYFDLYRLLKNGQKELSVKTGFTTFQHYNENLLMGFQVLKYGKPSDTTLLKIKMKYTLISKKSKKGLTFNIEEGHKSFY